ncbi:MAG TPA: hypothetical protein VKA01_10165 [Vicinamibacteria bacterium]|nr:hypothetical protein [Vicinamibacteria bacterium]
MTSKWLHALALFRGLAAYAAPSALATGEAAPGPFYCAACGRTVAVCWPARSVLCRCGMRLLSPPQPH